MHRFRLNTFYNWTLRLAFTMVYRVLCEISLDTFLYRPFLAGSLVINFHVDLYSFSPWQIFPVSTQLVSLFNSDRGELHLYAPHEAICMLITD